MPSARPVTTLHAQLRWSLEQAVRTDPGTYALILRCPADRCVKVGRLGKLVLRKGYYTYVGSAFGPGGVARRVRRHCRLEKRMHWHIDYVRPAMTVIEAWYTHDLDPREHQWARTLSRSARFGASVNRFGSSDCDCTSHLFHSPYRPDLSAFRHELDASLMGSRNIDYWRP